MTFEIPLSARAAANRIHRQGVPAPAPAEAGDRVEWRSFVAYWSREEKRMVAGLPASELAFLHEAKATLDAVLVEGVVAGDGTPLSPSSPPSMNPATKKGPQ